MKNTSKKILIFFIGTIMVSSLSYASGPRKEPLYKSIYETNPKCILVDYNSNSPFNYQDYLLVHEGNYYYFLVGANNGTEKWQFGDLSSFGNVLTTLCESATIIAGREEEFPQLDKLFKEQDLADLLDEGNMYLINITFDNLGYIYVKLVYVDSGKLIKNQIIAKMK